MKSGSAPVPHLARLQRLPIWANTLTANMPTWLGLFTETGRLTFRQYQY